MCNDTPGKSILKLVQFVKFDSHLFQNNEDIVPNFQTFYTETGDGQNFQSPEAFKNDTSFKVLCPAVSTDVRYLLFIKTKITAIKEN